MSLHQHFRDHQANNTAAFIPFLPAGDPSLATTEAIIYGLAEQDITVLELGVPFSDPTADGPTILQSYDRALANNITLTDCLHLVHRVRHNNCQIHTILFSYYNPILQYGISDFASDAATAGIDAVLVVDLPPHESQSLQHALGQHRIGSIYLISPTTPPARIREISAHNPDFLYYISRTGVTGAQSTLSSTLAQEIAQLRKHTSLPIAIGFGISTPEQVHTVAQLAEGVVVGSTLVKTLQASADPQRCQKNFIDKAKQLQTGLFP